MKALNMRETYKLNLGLIGKLISVGRMTLHGICEGYLSLWMCSFVWYFSTFTIEKNWLSQNLLEKWISWEENLKKCTSFEEQKCTRYIQENVHFGIIIFSCLSSTKLCLRFLLNCFVQEKKGFYQSSSGNEVDFRDIMSVSPNILAKNKISKN